MEYNQQNAQTKVRIARNGSKRKYLGLNCTHHPPFVFTSTVTWYTR